MNERRHQFDVAYMRMALSFSELSRARKNKVGALIVNEDDQIIAQGFNGTPSGFDNNCEDEWCTKYDENTDICRKNCEFAKNNDCKDCGYWKLKTKKEVLHAEPNAIMKCVRNGHSTKNATIYVTLSPCIDCAKLIIQAQIKRVVCLESYKSDEGIKLLSKAGIIVEKIDL